MPDTWHIHERCFGLWEDPMLCIFNNEARGSRAHYFVENLTICPAGTFTPTVVDTRIHLRRITACSGGRTDQVVIAKHNLGNPDLPSQVSIVLDPDSVTMSTYYRSSMAGEQALQTPLVQDMWMIGNRYRKSLESVGDIWMAGYQDAAIQPLTIAEGEGVTLCVPNEFFYQWTQGATITLKDLTNSRIYTISGIIALDPRMPDGVNRPLIAIMNGAGSGLTLGLMEIHITPLGNIRSSTAAGVPVEGGYVSKRIVRISSVSDGAVVGPVAHNLGTTAPASLVVRKHDGFDRPVAELAWGNTALNFEALGTWGYMSHIYGKNMGQMIGAFAWRQQPGAREGEVYSQFVCPSHTFGGEFPSGLRFTPRKGDMQPIVLAPQDGVAVWNNACGYYHVSCYIEATVTKQTLGVPTYPAEADVRDTVYYGPTGVEYEGDLVAGSGGGSTWMRRR